MLFAIGFLIGGVKCNQAMNQANSDSLASADNGAQIGTIGEFPIYDGPLQKNAPDPASATPSSVATAYAQGLDAQVTHGLLIELAKKQGVSLDDDSVMKAAAQQLDEGLQMQKMELSMQKQLPQNATDQQFSDYVKKATGKTLEEFKQDTLDKIRQKLSDSKQRLQQLGDLANDLVDKGIQSKLSMTDDELQHSQDTMEMKRVFLQTSKHPGKDVKKMAEGILADIKAKKLTFEQAMDKYSDDVPAKGKAAHDNTMELDMQTLKVNSDYQPLKSMKPGEISDVLPVAPNGFAIYRYEKYKANPIPDFQKQKDTLRKNFLASVAATQLQDGLKQLRQQKLIKWDDPGWGILYDWYETTTADNSFGEKPTSEQEKIQKDFLEKATSTKSGDPRGSTLAAAAILDKLWSTATASQKKSLKDQYIKVLAMFADNFGSYSADVQLAQLAAENKDGALANKSLLNAISFNAGNVNLPDGPKNFSDLAAMADKFQSDGVLSSDQIKAIEDKLDDFRKERLLYDKQTAEDRKQEEIQKEKLAADRARLAAEAAKKNPPTEKIPGPVKPKFPPSGAPPSAPGLNLVPNSATTGSPSSQPPAPKPAPKTPPSAPTPKPKG